MHELVHDFWNIMRRKFLHRSGARMHRKSKPSKAYKKSCVTEFPEYMNMYILTEGRNFKTFSKENYAIALHSFYLFNKTMLNMKLSMMLIVLMELALAFELLVLNEIFYCENTFANFRERFVISFRFSATGNTKSFL